MNENVDEIRELSSFIKSLFPKIGSISKPVLITPKDDLSKEPLNYRLSDEQLDNYFLDEFRQLKEEDVKFKLKFIRYKPHQPLCGSGRITINITPYGEVNPCVQIRLKNNSLKDNSLSNIWHNHPGIQKMRKLTMSNEKACRKCNLFSYCSTCPGITLMEEGSLLKPLRESCRIAYARKYAFKKVFMKTGFVNRLK